MRKEARTVDQVRIHQVNPYHHGDGTARNYAYDGFSEKLLFVSDRAVKLQEKLINGKLWLVKPDGTPISGIGLEIEMECWGIKSETILAESLKKVIFTHFPDKLFKLQSDCTLDGGESSAEAITQVMTKAFVRNHYKDFKIMFDEYFPPYGISCSQTGNCGMHCNLSNGLFGKTKETQDDNIRKLYYIINKHYAFSCALLFRDMRYNGWCHQMNYHNARNLTLSGNSSDHGICFNLGHYDEGRVELRLVGGQKNFACFRNTMESIFHLVHAVNTLKWEDLDDLTKVFRGCNQYVFDRLNSYCKERGTIGSTELDVIRQTVKYEELL